MVKITFVSAQNICPHQPKGNKRKSTIPVFLLKGNRHSYIANRQNVSLSFLGANKMRR